MPPPLTLTHRKQQTPQFPSIHPQPLFIPSAGFLCAFLCLSWFLLGCYVCRLIPSVLCSPSFRLFLYTATTNQHRPAGQHCSVLVGARWSFLEEVIHHISNVEMSGRTRPRHTYTHTCSSDRERPEPAGSHNSSEEEEYQTTGSFFCRGLEKHGRRRTAGALLKRTRDQPPLRFHSHVREVTFTVLKNELQIRKWGKSQRTHQHEGKSSKPIFKPVFERRHVKADVREK